MKNTKKGMSKTKLAAIGAGVAAIGAGAYYLLGPKAKKHQKQASELFLRIKKEVEAEAKKAKKDVSKIVKKTAKNIKDRI